MQRDLIAARDAARTFAVQHAQELARNLNQWQDTGLLPAECKLRELHEICRPIGNSDTMALAESYANRACREVAALASAPAAEPVAFVNGDDLDNMLADRTATIQSRPDGSRRKPLYAGPHFDPQAQRVQDPEEVFKAMDALFQPLAPGGWTLLMVHKDGKRGMKSWWAERPGQVTIRSDEGFRVVPPSEQDGKP